MIDPLAGKQEEIAALCQKYGVLRLDVFGSAAKGTFDPEKSDLDFVASFADRTNLDYADRYLDFAEALEALFGRPVDLITEQGIKNPYFREEVEETRRRVYVAPAKSEAA
jgi:predicted nucleotidyltransferase